MKVEVLPVLPEDGLHDGVSQAEGEVGLGVVDGGVRDIIQRPEVVCEGLSNRVDWKPPTPRGRGPPSSPKRSAIVAGAADFEFRGPLWGSHQLNRNHTNCRMHFRVACAPGTQSQRTQNTQAGMLIWGARGTRGGRGGCRGEVCV